MDVCYACGKFGNRADVCPSPEKSICRGCGTPKPKESHHCSPKCGLCGGPHLTADEHCKQRFQIPYVVRRRRQKGANKEARLQQIGSTPSNAEPAMKRIAPEPEAIQALGANRDLGDAPPKEKERPRALDWLGEAFTPQDLHHTPETKIVSGSQPGPIESEEERRERR
ncbi:hypothetical protein HPB52_013394 [Rhipicephalus sanguineus]|uniref:CCHC-type domain-containing protein n=1 Tax=Rhipicephalus sanguineus TaxID=34632 RepID=A0A9D4QB24_RHISA|nr:hypothetical protein HPB52_013394 [Rhipicephalus sanguineus]